MNANLVRASDKLKSPGHLMPDLNKFILKQYGIRKP